MAHSQRGKHRHHRDWKRRFYWTAGTMLAVNVLLLFLLAVSYLRPIQAFESTKVDAQLLAQWLTAATKGQPADEWLNTIKHDRKVKWEHNQVSIGGINVYRNENGELIRVEHWSKPKR